MRSPGRSGAAAESRRALGGRGPIWGLSWRLWSRSPCVNGLFCSSVLFAAAGEGIPPPDLRGDPDKAAGLIIRCQAVPDHPFVLLQRNNIWQGYRTRYYVPGGPYQKL